MSFPTKQMSRYTSILQEMGMGGNPHALIQVRKPGRRGPASKIIRFDDYVQVRLDAPDTNFYGTGDAECDSGYANWQREVIIKSEVPFYTPRHIDLGYGQLYAGVYNGAGTFSFGVACYLLRVPLDNDPVPPPSIPNPWALNVLTYNLIGRNPPGTFWSTPGNYYYLGSVMSHGCLGIPGDYTSSRSLLSLGINFFAVADLALLDAAGPFYGIGISMIAGTPIHTAQVFAPTIGTFGAHILEDDIHAA